MSRFSNLLTYSWSSTIDDNPIEINAYGRDVEEARREVLAILAEIARIKPEYDVLEKEAYARVANSLEETLVAPKTPKNWAQVAGSSPKPRSFHAIREDQRALIAHIPANFFNGSFSASTIDYTPDRIVGSRDQTLADFIRTTEPTCEGPVRMVSFRSCLDG